MSILADLELDKKTKEFAIAVAFCMPFWYIFIHVKNPSLIKDELYVSIVMSYCLAAFSVFLMTGFLIGFDVIRNKIVRIDFFQSAGAGCIITISAIFNKNDKDFYEEIKEAFVALFWATIVLAAWAIIKEVIRRKKDQARVANSRRYKIKNMSAAYLIYDASYLSKIHRSF